MSAFIHPENLPNTVASNTGIYELMPSFKYRFDYLPPDDALLDTSPSFFIKTKVKNIKYPLTKKPCRCFEYGFNFDTIGAFLTTIA